MDQANLDVLSAQIVVLADVVTILAQEAEAREQENAGQLDILSDTLALAGDFLALLAIQAESADEDPGQSAQHGNQPSRPGPGKAKTARLVCRPNGLGRKR